MTPNAEKPQTVTVDPETDYRYVAAPRVHWTSFIDWEGMAEKITAMERERRRDNVLRITLLGALFALLVVIIV